MWHEFHPCQRSAAGLESQGFVSFVHNRRAWVTPLSLDDLEDLYLIRLELECQPVRQAAPFTKAEIARLDDLLAQSLVASR